MSAGEGKSSGKEERKFDLTGEKCAYIFSFEPPTVSNVEDTDCMCSTLRNLEFQILDASSNPSVMDEELDNAEVEDSSSDDEEQFPIKEELVKNNNTAPVYSSKIIANVRPKDFVEFVDEIAASKTGASCILLYIIARQVSYDLVTEDNKALPLFHIWKKFKGIKCPKLFFLQANVTNGARIQSVLLNSEKDEASKHFTLPESANMLLAYLPNCSNKEMSVAKILKEELCKPFDINANMTAVIGRLKSMGCKPCPKFSSTLIEQLYFKGGSCDPRDKLPVYNCRRGRCLAYAFLFGKFSNRDLYDLSFLIKTDSKCLKNTFSDLGFELEFCVPNGRMTKDEFDKKLVKILQDKEKLESCDCITIIISSHGNKCGILHATDHCFTVDSVWEQLANCKELEGKPKVLAIDACRGNFTEKSVKHVISKGSSQKIPPNPADMIAKTEDFEMSDVIVALASTEGMRSYGSDCAGSTFIGTLCETMKSHGRGNFFTLLNSTMHKVAHTDFYDWDDKASVMVQVKQQVTFTSTLLKLFYLPEK